MLIAEFLILVLLIFSQSLSALILFQNSFEVVQSSLFEGFQFIFASRRLCSLKMRSILWEPNELLLFSPQVHPVGLQAKAMHRNFRINIGV